MTESISLAMGESSPVKIRLSLTDSTCTPLRVRLQTVAQVVHVMGEPIHAVTASESPSRANRSSSVSCGWAMSLLEAAGVSGSGPAVSRVSGRALAESEQASGLLDDRMCTPRNLAPQSFVLKVGLGPPRLETSARL